MEHQHIHRIFQNPVYLKKAHTCVHCGEKLKKVKVSRIVDSASSEAKGFDFSTGGTYMVGKVKFLWDEMQCPGCKRQYTIEELKKLEA